jgi:hypothetical protein
MEHNVSASGCEKRRSQDSFIQWAVHWRNGCRCCLTNAQRVSIVFRSVECGITKERQCELATYRSQDYLPLEGKGAFFSQLRKQLNK